MNYAKSSSSSRSNDRSVLPDSGLLQAADDPAGSPGGQQASNSNPIRVAVLGPDAHESVRLSHLLVETGCTAEALESNGISFVITHLQKGQPDVVLLDFGAVEGFGMQCLAQLRAKVPTLPIVALTRTADDSVVAQALQAGAQDFLTQTGHLDGGLLFRTLHYAMDRMRYQNCLGMSTGVQLNRDCESLAAANEELRKENARLEEQAFLDPLSGTLNRRGLQRVISRELRANRRQGADLTALLVDLDDFKSINSRHGHSAGDRVIREVADGLRRGVRETDFVARIGGDEFLVLLPGTRLAEGLRVAEKLRLAISCLKVQMATVKIDLTASIGVALIPNRNLTVDELVANTQRQLLHSKQVGKNKVACFEQQHNGVSSVTGDHPARELLERLTGDQGFTTVQLPIVRLIDRQVVGIELLTQFDDGVFKMPDSLFRASLEADILSQVDLRCLTSCLQAAQALPSSLRVHINLFPTTLVDLTHSTLLEAFMEWGAGRHFCVEINEQHLVGDATYLVEPIRELREVGIKLALDDVGFGRTSLESLLLLDPDVVKLDQRLVLGATHDEGRRRVLKRLIKLLRSTGAPVVAKGIGTDMDVETLTQIGVPYGQGGGFEVET